MRTSYILKQKNYSKYLIFRNRESIFSRKWFSSIKENTNESHHLNMAVSHRQFFYGLSFTLISHCWYTRKKLNNINIHVFQQMNVISDLIFKNGIHRLKENMIQVFRFFWKLFNKRFSFIFLYIFNFLFFCEKILQESINNGAPTYLYN